MKNTFSGMTALVTGASFGLGADFARALAAAGAHLILTARSMDRLQALRQEIEQRHRVRVTVIAEDLSDPQGPERLARAIQAMGTPVDVLINNAGFGQHGPFVGEDAQSQVDMVNLNVMALMKLARIYLPDMMKRGRGWILNVASTAAFQPGPNMAVYFATKAFVLSLSEALWLEARGRGVQVTALCPGATDTRFADRADMNDSLLFRYGVAKPKDVVAAGLAALAQGKRVVIPGIKNKVGVWSAKFLPKRWVMAIAGKLAA